MTHRNRVWVWVIVLGLLVAGCNVTRQNYLGLSLSQTKEEVKKALGSPRYQFGQEWVYTNDDPRDLTKVVVRFGEDDKVVGKSWQNPEKPWENNREGEVP